MMSSIQIHTPSVSHKFKQHKNKNSIKMAEKNYGDSVQTSFRHHSDMVQTSLRQHPNMIQTPIKHHSDIIQTLFRKQKNDNSLKYYQTTAGNHSFINTSCQTKHNHGSSSRYGVTANPLRMPCEAVGRPQKATNHRAQRQINDDPKLNNYNSSRMTVTKKARTNDTRKMDMTQKNNFVCKDSWYDQKNNKNQ